MACCDVGSCHIRGDEGSVSVITFVLSVLAPSTVLFTMLEEVLRLAY
jgi:hypothetical protein